MQTEDKLQNNPNPKYTFYNKNLVVLNPNGFNNTGAICWFNSMIQVLMGLPAFNKYMIGNKSMFKNELADCYINMITSRHINEMQSINLFSKFIQQIKRSKTTLEIVGQEGVENGFVVFLDSLGEIYNDITKSVYGVFNNKYERFVVCDLCQNIAVVDYGRHPFINLYGINTAKTQREFELLILSRKSPLTDYKCEKCQKVLEQAYHREELVGLRDVIFVSFIPPGCDFKSNLNSNNWYPEKINFLSVENKLLRYKVVGTVEHYGTLNPKTYSSSGHYCARSMRQDIPYLFNDISYRQCNLLPTPNTYMVAYHVYAHDDIQQGEEYYLTQFD